MVEIWVCKVIRDKKGEKGEKGQKGEEGEKVMKE